MLNSIPKIVFSVEKRNCFAKPAAYAFSNNCIYCTMHLANYLVKSCLIKKERVHNENTYSTRKTVMYSKICLRK